MTQTAGADMLRRYGLAGDTDVSRVLGLSRSVSAAFGGLLVLAPFVLVLGASVLEGPTRRGAQPTTVDQALRCYEQMLARPHLVISNGGPSFAFRYPALYSVAADGDVGRLRSIGAAIRSVEARPSIEIGP